MSPKPPIARTTLPTEGLTARADSAAAQEKIRNQKSATFQEHSDDIIQQSSSEFAIKRVPADYDGV